MVAAIGSMVAAVKAWGSHGEAKKARELAAEIKTTIGIQQAQTQTLNINVGTGGQGQVTNPIPIFQQVPQAPQLQPGQGQAGDNQPEEPHL